MNTICLSAAHAYPSRGQACTGEAKIEVETSYVVPKPAGPLKVVIRVNGKKVASGVVPVGPTVIHRQRLPRHRHRFGLAGSVDYYDKAPFKFNGEISNVHVKYTK